jgi:amidase
MLYELKHDLNAYLAERGGAVKSLAGVIAFNEREAAREMPYFGQENLIKAEAKGPLTDKAYVDAREKSKRIAAGGIDAAMDKHGLAAIIAPTDGLAWLTDYINGDHFTQSCATPAAVAGYPHITVPAGFVTGLPVGLSFFGRANSEALLIGLAHSFERITHARRAPRFLAHALPC